MCDLCSAVADFKHEVGDNLVQHTDGLGKWFVWEAWVRAGVAVSEKEQTDCEDG